MNDMTIPDAKDADRAPFGRVPVEVTVSVGRARPTVAELLRLRPDAILTLDRSADEPVEIFAGDRLIARGTLEEAEGEEPGRLAVRLTEITDLDNAL
ncbi:FliM/FliN family flagellar motor C-terminal domain-containing protein [Jannaschia sp. LMIT008]|uniref:FliM/FliN family flagellar motor C-terminal domain-containing protein n=1 Tax=Jannaschia maritima TaxID=3032585 RepID=UPI002811F54A|nr:FliM/FliN family flagellar motor C-terminal domain-containing protein [Jannaschia sp. LMIT008]